MQEWCTVPVPTASENGTSTEGCVIVVLGSGFHSKSAHSLRSGIMDVRAMLQNGMKKIALGTGKCCNGKELASYTLKLFCLLISFSLSIMVGRCCWRALVLHAGCHPPCCACLQHAPHHQRRQAVSVLVTQRGFLHGNNGRG